MEDSINKENVPEDEWDILPCGHRICIEPEMAPDKTRGGLFVPISVKERHVNEAQVGTVTAIGPQAWKAFEDGTPWAEVGDRVACIKHAGVVLDILPKYRIMNDADMLCVLKRKRPEVENG